MSWDSAVKQRIVATILKRSLLMQTPAAATFPIIFLIFLTAIAQQWTFSYDNYLFLGKDLSWKGWEIKIEGFGAVIKFYHCRITPTTHL